MKIENEMREKFAYYHLFTYYLFIFTFLINKNFKTHQKHINKPYLLSKIQKNSKNNKNNQIFTK